MKTKPTTIAELSEIIGTWKYIYNEGRIIKVEILHANVYDGSRIHLAVADKHGDYMGVEEDFDDVYDTFEEAQEAAIELIKKLK